MRRRGWDGDQKEEGVFWFVWFLSFFLSIREESLEKKI